MVTMIIIKLFFFKTVNLLIIKNITHSDTSEISEEMELNLSNDWPVLRNDDLIDKIYIWRSL